MSKYKTIEEEVLSQTTAFKQLQKIAAKSQLEIKEMQEQLNKLQQVQRDLITMQMHVYQEHFKDPNQTIPAPTASSPSGAEKHDSKSNLNTTKSKT